MRARNRLRAGGLRLFLFVMLCLAGPAVRADWNGLAGYGAVAEASLEPGRVHLSLRIRKDAAERLAKLPAPGLPAPSPAEVAARLLEVRDRLDRPLPGRLTGFSEQPANADSGEPARFEAELDFVVPDHVSTLTLVPPSGTGPKDIGLVVLHRGVPVSDLAPLPAAAELRLDWRDPWKSRFTDPERIRRHTEPRSYLYVEPYEVRHEILIPLRDLAPALWPDGGGPAEIPPAEAERLREAIGAYLLGRNPVRIDGEIAPPQLDRVDFLRYERAGVRPLPAGQPVDGAAALVGVILVHLTDRPAREVDLEWTAPLPREGRRPVSVQFGRESFDSDLSRGEPRLHWTAEDALDGPGAAPAAPARAEPAAPPLPGWIVRALQATGGILAFAGLFRFLGTRRRPAPGRPAELALLLFLAGCIALFPAIDRADLPAGAAPPSDEDLQGLLHNVYRAFPIRSEDAAYERLAQSLEGEALDEVYLRQRRSLLQRDGGLGGEGRVERVDLLESRVIGASDEGVKIAARWIAHGTVSHWGHSHRRSNEYRATFVVGQSPDGRWRIQGLDFGETRRATAAAS